VRTTSETGRNDKRVEHAESNSCAPDEEAEPIAPSDVRAGARARLIATFGKEMDAFEKLTPGQEDPVRRVECDPGLQEIAFGKTKRDWIFWSVALTFVWASVVVVAANRLFRLEDASLLLLFGYPLACGAAGILLLRRKRSVKGPFAFLNIALGLLWFFSVATWIAQEFSKNLWR
jgi:hypothetical protein